MKCINCKMNFNIKLKPVRVIRCGLSHDEMQDCIYYKKSKWKFWVAG